jgi:hypothetical protein
MLFSDSAVLFEGGAAVAIQGSNRQFCVTDFVYCKARTETCILCIWSLCCKHRNGQVRLRASPCRLVFAKWYYLREFLFGRSVMPLSLDTHLLFNNRKDKRIFKQEMSFRISKEHLTEKVH